MEMIQSVRFGSVRIDNRRFCLRDVIIRPDGTIRRRPLGRWLKQHHAIGREDIAPLMAAGATTVVIGTGVFSLAKVKSEAQTCAQEARVELIVMPSRRAAEKFNELQATGLKVGALLHLMC